MSALAPVVDAAPRGLPRIAAVVLSAYVVPIAVGLLGIWLCVATVALLPETVLKPLGLLGVYSLGICGAHLPVIAALVALRWVSPWVVFPVALIGSLVISVLLDQWSWSRVTLLGGRSRAVTNKPDAGPPSWALR